MKVNWNFLGEAGGGGGDGAKLKTFRGWGMDIFWNCTFVIRTQSNHSTQSNQKINLKKKLKIISIIL